MAIDRRRLGRRCCAIYLPLHTLTLLRARARCFPSVSGWVSTIPLVSDCWDKHSAVLGIHREHENALLVIIRHFIYSLAHNTSALLSEKKGSTLLIIFYRAYFPLSDMYEREKCIEQERKRERGRPYIRISPPPLSLSHSLTRCLCYIDKWKIQERERETNIFFSSPLLFS